MGPHKILTTTSNLVPTGLNDQVVAVVNWQTAMKLAIRSEARLRDELNLPKAVTGDTNAFSTFVPLEFLAKIRPGDPDDPLLRQVLPTASELVDASGFVADPVGDLAMKVAPGVLRKYQGRALVIATGACGIHCRYCFRREFPYAESGISNDWDQSLKYLREDTEIEEVLLSGGDPLTLVDQKVDRLLSDLESINHIKRVRIHSRMPVVIPQRVTTELVQRLKASRLTAWMVIHANHPNELGDDVVQATDRMVDAGIPVLNQAVLMRGVNDDLETLVELCKRLVNHRIQPYYLHQLDRVRGAAHFEVPVKVGLRLAAELRARLPGYAVPVYVSEVPGKSSKTLCSELD